MTRHFFQIDQGQSALGIEFALQLLAGIVQHQLQRRPHMRLKKMSSHRGAVPLSHHDVSMHLGLALIECDVADQRNHLDLFIDLVLQVVLLLQVEIPDAGVAEGADRREMGGRDLVLLGKLRQRGDNLVSRIEDQTVPLFKFLLFIEESSVRDTRRRCRHRGRPEAVRRFGSTWNCQSQLRLRARRCDDRRPDRRVRDLQELPPDGADAGRSPVRSGSCN